MICSTLSSCSGVSASNCSPASRIASRVVGASAIGDIIPSRGIRSVRSSSMVVPMSWREIDWRRHEADLRLGSATVHYADIGSGGPAVLFVHGLGGQWRNWLENLP